jgi:Tfp pilus assembly protein PilZ
MNGMAVERNPREFSELVDELAELEVERTGTGVGLSGERAARRTRIERRLMHLMCVDIGVDERRSSIRVPTNLVVRLKAAGHVATGKMTNVGAGGAFIEVALPVAVRDDVLVTIERPPASLEHSFQLRGRVAWLASADGRRCAGFGMSFAAASDADERRLRRLVLDVLRVHAPGDYE